MFKKNLKLKLIFSGLFIILLLTIYYYVNQHKTNQINQILTQQIKTIKLHFNLTLQQFQNNTSSAINSLRNDKNIVDILAKAQNSSNEQKNILRKELHKYLIPYYNRMKKKGVFQFQFIFPNNISFLKMHEPEKYGDNLSDIRYSIRYTNETKKSISGFESGRYNHAFRHIYPFFNKEDKYLGAVEMSFSSKKIQDNLTNLNKIHSHFIVNKNVFKIIEKTYQDKYLQSVEHNNFLFTKNFTKNHNHLQEKCLIITPLKKQIAKNIALKKEFALYVPFEDKVKVISFLPIKDLKSNNTKAYLVSYTNNIHIQSILNQNTKMKIIIFFAILILFIFIYRILTQKEYLEKEVENKTQELLEINNNLESEVIKRIKEISNLNNEIHNTQKEVVFTMGSIGETRSKETGNHVKRVAQYSKLFALKYGISNEDAELLCDASPMHDIGKVGIEDCILNKPSKFTKEEFYMMQEHSKIGYEMLKYSERPLLKLAAIIALQHHEKWDGTGYPYGLKGEDIDINGRITAISDVFDALGSNRCYKKAWDDEKIFKLFKEEKGKHFDPKLVDIFFNNLDKFLAIRDNLKDN